MASQVEICNRALIKLGAGQITSITDNSKQARILSALWDTVRKSEMTKRFWMFSLVRTTLPALADKPSWGFAYQYQLPPDFLKLAQVNDTFIAPGQADYRASDDSPYAIEGGVIMPEWGARLRIRYVQDSQDTGLFDDLFGEVMASKLAYESCYSITQSRDGQRAAQDDYKAALRDASISNAIAKPPQGLPDDSWMLGRL